MSKFVVQLFNEDKTIGIPCKLAFFENKENDNGEIDKVLTITVDNKFLNISNILRQTNEEQRDVGNVVKKITFNDILSKPLDAFFVFAINKQLMEFFTWDLVNNNEMAIKRIEELFPHIDDMKALVSLKRDYDRELEDHEKNSACKVCIGEINRKYITKVIPYFHSYIDNVILVDIENIFNLQLSSEEIEENINIAEFKNLAKGYRLELDEAIKQSKCTNCTKNKIKAKYLDLVKNLLNNKQIDINNIPQGLSI